MRKQFFRALWLMAMSLLLIAPGWAQEPVAVVLGRAVHREPANEPQDSVNARILLALLKDFADRQGISVTDSEVAQIEKAFNASSSRPAPSAAEQAALREVMRDMVRQWKISKALYERYGGEVIFQQSNPLEPVGAMRRFLEEQEKAGALRFHGAQDRQRFFEYFVRPQTQVIPPARVNYDKPWWRQ